jgi:hypothetical protein
VGTPTASLLWAVCRPQFRADEVRSAVEAGADLPEAAGLAITQRVSPLLWRALTQSGIVDETPAEEWAVQLMRDSARCRAHAALVLPDIAPRALVPLADAGVMPLVYKGATLAGRYPAPGLRPMDDVDLVLPPEEIDRGVATLEKAGWKVVAVSSSAHHEVILSHDALPGLPIELHRALATWRERSNHLTTLDLWRWRAEGEVLGAPAFTLPPEEELIALAAHAAKPFHVFDRLIWAVDVAVVLGAATDARPIDWERVVRLADEAVCRTALAVALCQAQRLGADSPEEVRRIPATGARVGALDPVLSEEWPLIDRDGSLRRRLRYALVDDWRQRVTLFLGHIIRWGPAAAPRHAVDLGGHALRRWWRLRREASRHRSQAGL